MQTFRDSITGKIWQFDADVIVTNTNGIYSFTAANGDPLSNSPATLQPYTIPAPTSSELLQAAQATQIATLTAAYNGAIQQSVAYLGNTFQADSASQQTLTRCLVAGSVPSGFYWLNANNVQVPMTYVELQGLAGAMLAQGQTAFSHLQAKKAEVMAATTPSAVESVIW